ncbi:MAG: hypothetical protein V4721_00520 [Bacteroidota bacterium]
MSTKKNTKAAPEKEIDGVSDIGAEDTKVQEGVNGSAGTDRAYDGQTDDEIAENTKQHHAVLAARAEEKKQKELDASFLKHKVDIDTMTDDLEDKKFPVLEEQIEAWRENTNNIMLIVDKVRAIVGGVPQEFQNRFSRSMGKLYELEGEYAEKYKTQGFKILMERTGVDAKGYLVVAQGSDKEAYGMINDIRSAVDLYNETGRDRTISVVSGLSEHTKVAEILVSTIGGYALQSFDILANYKSPKRLLPLDVVPKQPRATSNEGPLKLVI